MTQLVSGLVSVTFRELQAAEIVELAARAGVLQLEWGSDIHVPPGDVRVAREVGVRTREAGLDVGCYGSYYRVGVAGQERDFDRCVVSAVELGAPVIRVWAGNCGSSDADDDVWRCVEEDTQRICALAHQAGIAVAFEFHGGTLTDSTDTVIALLDRLNLSNLRTLWQPLGAASPGERAGELGRLLPWLAHVHVYQWPGGVRVPLSEGEEEWVSCLSTLEAVRRPVGLFLEFVRDDSPDQFLRDAHTLKRWITRIDGGATP